MVGPARRCGCWSPDGTLGRWIAAVAREHQVLIALLSAVTLGHKPTRIGDRGGGEFLRLGLAEQNSEQCRSVYDHRSARQPTLVVTGDFRLLLILTGHTVGLAVGVVVGLAVGIAVRVAVGTGVRAAVALGVRKAVGVGDRLLAKVRTFAQ